MLEAAQKRTPVNSLPNQVKKKWHKRFLRKIGFLFLKVFVLFFVVTLFQVGIVRYWNPSFTVRMLIERVECLVQKKTYTPPVYIFKPLQLISPHLRRAVLASEDQRFLTHNGFDFIELNEAIKTLLRRNKVRGASTITMQVARTLYLTPSRTLKRKIGEAYYTVLIELFWTKRRILEIYLNTVDWGAGIMGAEAAARTYYQKSCFDLNPHQAASLVSILPSPHKWSPLHPDKKRHQRISKIINDMKLMPLL